MQTNNHALKGHHRIAGQVTEPDTNRPPSVASYQSPIPNRSSFILPPSSLPLLAFDVLTFRRFDFYFAPLQNIPPHMLRQRPNHLVDLVLRHPGYSCRRVDLHSGNGLGRIEEEFVAVEERCKHVAPEFGVLPSEERCRRSVNSGAFSEQLSRGLVRPLLGQRCERDAPDGFAPLRNGAFAQQLLRSLIGPLLAQGVKRGAADVITFILDGALGEQLSGLFVRPLLAQGLNRAGAGESVPIFDGVLITDFWAAYDSVEAPDRQKCIPHLLRELEKVDLRNDSTEWHAFAKKLRRMLRDGIRLRKRPDFAPKRYQSRIDRLNRRVGEMAREEHADADARRLTKRLRRYGEYLFTFLDYPYVPADNNFGERQIRPAVILRKNSQSNRSDRGAATQAVLMSVYRTLRLRALNPTKTIADALKTYLLTGRLPALPV